LRLVRWRHEHHVGGLVRVLIEPGSYRCQNMGDVAMLQVAARRLTRVLPGAELAVFTGDDARLATHCPGARPVPSEGRAVWLAERRWLPGGLVGVPGHGVISQRAPAELRRLALSLALGLRRRDRRPLTAFLDAFGAAELLVVCGQGSMGDATARHASTVLATLELAQAAGLPTAMLGQGIGPLIGPRLRARAAAILPRVNLVALRDGLGGLPLLRELGVAPERIVVTGDDAIELAYEFGPADGGAHLGVNIRVSENAGVEGSVVADVREALGRFLAKRRVGVAPLPIAQGSAADARVLADLIGALGAASVGSEDLARPADVIEQVGHCRIVVTGAYHAAVFALSRGVPAVCLSSSPYYQQKFEGLRALFGEGCSVVTMDPPGLADRLSEVLETAWDRSAELRTPLRQAAAAQIQFGQAAYQRLAALVARPEPGSRSLAGVS
jgi:polysaccharide pyruvyl transferase WcaK-like protein